MTKEQWMALLVLLAAAVAAGLVARAMRRRRGRFTPPSLPTGMEAPASASEPPPAAETPAAPPKALTQRERRRDEIRILAHSEKCIYCPADAEHPLPYAVFVRPSLDVSSFLTGDMPRHWHARAPSEHAAEPLLCASHATIARSAIELRIAECNADYARFVAAQKEAMHEFTAHGLDELMRAEADRVRKGTAKGIAS